MGEIEKITNFGPGRDEVLEARTATSELAWLTSYKLQLPKNAEYRKLKSYGAAIDSVFSAGRKTCRERGYQACANGFPKQAFLRYRPVDFPPSIGVASKDPWERQLQEWWRYGQVYGREYQEAAFGSSA